MDLLGEASSETRILSARHIGADQTLPDTSDAINTTILCHTYSLQPDFQTYLAGLQPFAWVVWSYGLLVLLTVSVLYVVSIRLALRNWKEHISHVAVILAVYPIVTASGFITLLVPRSRMVAEAVAQEAVMVAMYHMYCLIIAECNGMERLVRRAEGARLETRVLPCCCWPCCVIPKPLLSKKIFTWLKFLILQMPVIQAILYIILLVLFAEDMGLYLIGFSYVQPFIVISIMLGVWGMIMSVRAAESAGTRPRKRFLALQLALIIVKLQYALGKVLPEIFDLPCILALHPTVFVHMLQNIIMMFEMLLLSTWAYCLYSKSAEKVTTSTQQVVIAVLEDNMPSVDDRAIAGVENRSFENRI